MTVDRTHVLATPGMDAHSSYVALSRHRAGTALHYGRDDFADEAQVRRTLGRERPKDMALDYEGRQAQRPYATRSATADTAAPLPRTAVEQATRAAASNETKPGKESAGPEPPAQQSRARKLRDSFAALGKTPQRSAEQARADFAASAKAQPSAARDRDRDHGAER